MLSLLHPQNDTKSSKWTSCPFLIPQRTGKGVEGKVLVNRGETDSRETETWGRVR